jgi:hypothetical protein
MGGLFFVEISVVQLIISFVLLKTIIIEIVDFYPL